MVKILISSLEDAINEIEDKCIVCHKKATITLDDIHYCEKHHHRHNNFFEEDGIFYHEETGCYCPCNPCSHNQIKIVH